MTPEATSAPVSRLALARIALGTLVLQASYHPERRQAIGVAAALAPLGPLWTTPEERSRFLLRHLEPMNTNPAMAGILLGALARLEARAAAGDARALALGATLKRHLEGPLAAAGDALLWAGLRPAAALAGGIAVWFTGAIGIAVFLGAYNLVHLGIRLGGVYWGFRRGEEVVRVLRAGWLRAALRWLPWTLWAGGLVLAAVVVLGSGPAGWIAAPVAAVGAELGRRGVARGGLLAGGAIVIGLLLALVMNR